MVGKVKWFNSEKGFGFVTGQDGNAYFVHYSNIEGRGFRSLEEGDSVDFMTEHGAKGPVAVSVRKI